MLNLKENEEVVFLRRIVSLNNYPYALLDTYMPEIFKGVADTIAKAKNLKTTYQIGEEQFDFVIKEAKYDISVSRLDKRIKKTTKIKKRIILFKKLKNYLFTKRKAS